MPHILWNFLKQWYIKIQPFRTWLHSTYRLLGFNLLKKLYRIFQLDEHFLYVTFIPNLRNKILKCYELLYLSHRFPVKLSVLFEVVSSILYHTNGITLGTSMIEVIKVSLSHAISVISITFRYSSSRFWKVTLQYQY